MVDELELRRLRPCYELLKSLANCDLRDCSKKKAKQRIGRGGWARERRVLVEDLLRCSIYIGAWSGVRRFWVRGVRLVVGLGLRAGFVFTVGRKNNFPKREACCNINRYVLRDFP